MRGLLGWGKNRAGELGAKAFDTREKHNLHQSKQRKDKEVAGKAVATLPWTSQDLEMLPDNGKRYEIIDGELYVSIRPHYYHQRACGLVFKLLDNWSEQTEAGEANLAPGLIFAEDDDVAPTSSGRAENGWLQLSSQMASCMPHLNWSSKFFHLV